MARYFRLAAAGFFALQTVALIGLWVRSYYRVDIATAPLGRAYGIYWSTHRGRALCEVRHLQFPSPERWSLSSYPAFPRRAWRWENGFLYGLGFEVEIAAGLCYVMAPYWFWTGMPAALAALFAFKRSWRFSMRTLLVATTLVAGAFGLGVYLL
jgi:hypothetical protein